MQEWLILVYKVPPEPSRLRASIWRKLKAVGAIYLQNGVATLPSGPASERALRGIAEEARAMGGVAYLYQGGFFGEADTLVAMFNAARDEEYTEVLTRCQDFHAELACERAAHKYTFAELEENEEDLVKLEAWCAKIRGRDYFGATLEPAATQALAACRNDLEEFAASVYRAADHGSAAPNGLTEPEGGSPNEAGLA
jgi:hypothetical protein